MKHILSALAALAALAVCTPALAAEQPVAPYTQSDANAGATPFSGDHMFKALHGMAGIDRIVRGMMEANQNDPRIADFFKAADKERLRRTLVEQFCYVAGGPCHYTGMDMKMAHTHMGVKTKDFDALVEHLEDAMTKEGVSFRDQAKFLAKFAPMKRPTVDENPN
jgi:hemoglobin